MLPGADDHPLEVSAEGSGSVMTAELLHTFNLAFNTLQYHGECQV